MAQQKDSPNWVDFKEIKANISLKMVLDRYGIELKPGGQNLVGCCPIHKGSNPRQFSVNPEKNIWHCFGNCKEGGNVLDFVAMKERGNKEPDSIREAAQLNAILEETVDSGYQLALTECRRQMEEKKSTINQTL